MHSKLKLSRINASDGTPCALLPGCQTPLLGLHSRLLLGVIAARAPYIYAAAIAIENRTSDDKVIKRRKPC
jgi:hypothetical protein